MLMISLGIIQEVLMKLLQLYKKVIHCLLGALFLVNPIFPAQEEQNKDLFNNKFSNHVTVLNNEYHALEILREEESSPVLEWHNTERENQLGLTKPIIFISLGANCAPARHFERNHLTEAFFPFDWCISEVESVYKALEEDFHGYLKQENLKIFELAPNVTHRTFRDTYYKIIYPHDFSRDKEPLHDYEQIRNKYYRRIDRFYRALSLGKKVYFFRTGITKEEAKKLNALIRNKFPNLNYTLIVISDTEDFKKQWKIKRLRNFFIQGFQDATILNRKLLQDWDAVFQNLKIIPKPQQKKRGLTPLQQRRRISRLNQC
jgi:hypothetical protein